MEEKELVFGYDYYAYNPRLEDAEGIYLQEYQLFSHPDLEGAKNYIRDCLEIVKNKKENDICVTFFAEDEEKYFYHILIFKDNQWIESDDIENLKLGKYELLLQSEDFIMSNQLIVTSWEEIADNFRAFQKIDEFTDSKIMKYYSSFYHWYYTPEEGLFAPSKFLGYRNSNIADYDSSGSGGETQKALAKFFTKLEKTSPEFNVLYNELLQISHNSGKKLNDQVLNGKGGIYVPIKL